MKKLKTSEIVFLLIGLFLMSGSLLLLAYNISLAKFFNLHRSPGDPFEAAYYLKSDLQKSNAILKSTPPPLPNPHPSLPAAPTREQIVPESTKLSLYLNLPNRQALLLHGKHAPWPQKVVFKFEVYPKNTPVTLELFLKDQVIQSHPIPATSSGTHEFTAFIEKPGLYQWRVKTIDIKSELRTFIIHE